jgi:hypothetical protein
MTDGPMDLEHLRAEAANRGCALISGNEMNVIRKALDASERLREAYQVLLLEFERGRKAYEAKDDPGGEGQPET